jgi:hypothetical protein
MNNHSVHNEALISKIIKNLSENKRQSKVTTLRHTIFNSTILPELKKLPCNVAPRNDKQYRNNLAIAYKILRKHLRYNLASFCARNPQADSLYYTINDFKYELNSNFHNYFNYK